MKNLIGFVVTLGMLVLSPNHPVAQEYDHTIALERMSFSWRLDGKMIHIQLQAKTKGWVSIGFNPKRGMQGANFILGYVKRGKVTIQDEFGIRKTEHIKDVLNQGQDNVKHASGKEVRGKTTIAFTIPLNSGDHNDTAILPDSQTKVLLACGPNKDSFYTKHVFRTVLTVNLKTGEYTR